MREGNSWGGRKTIQNNRISKKIEPITKENKPDTMGNNQWEEKERELVKDFNCSCASLVKMMDFLGRSVLMGFSFLAMKPGYFNSIIYSRYL